MTIDGRMASGDARFAEAEAALERARSLTDAQAAELDRLLDALEVEREQATALRERAGAERERLEVECAALTRVAEATSGAMCAHLASAFEALLDSPAWRLGNGLPDAPRRLFGRPPSGTPAAARASCAALVRAGAAAPGSATEGERLADVEYWAARILDGSRYRLGRMVVRLLPWLNGSRRPEHELSALLRVARTQHEAARAALAACPKGATE